MFITLTINTTKTKSYNREHYKPSNTWRKRLNRQKRSFSKRFVSTINNSFQSGVKSLISEIHAYKQNMKIIQH